MVPASLLITMLLTSAGTIQSSDWEERAEARARHLRAVNGDGTNAQLKRVLLAVRDDDQGVRNRIFELPAERRDAL